MRCAPPLLPVAAAFTVLAALSTDAFSHSQWIHHVGQVPSNRLFSSANNEMSGGKSIIVISPPGGVGEVAAVKAACLGNFVRWFVVSKEAGSPTMTLSPQALQEVSDAGGSLDLVGSDVEYLKAGGDAVTAMSKWSSSAQGIICSYDGCGADAEFKSAVLIAAKEAGRGVKGPRVAVLRAEEDLVESEAKSSEDGLGSRVNSFLRGGKKGPSSLASAWEGNIAIVRHGELFGIPESSPDFSPLVGGPRCDPLITEEYAMRGVRVDPFLVSGNIMASSSRQTCRHAVGEAAALLATGILKPVPEDISIASQPGSEKWTLDQWEDEFSRVRETVASGKACTLFSQDMIVEDTERLAAWLATKWAPAVMRTYEIAAIRIGARPVMARRVDGSNVEIVWQELVDFETIFVGQVLIEVEKDGISVTREAGDASKGYGTVSKRPLPGEDILVRNLADAVSQSVEKGLAKKALPKKQKKKTEPITAVPVTSFQSAGSIERTINIPSQATNSSGVGPRGTGARRSTPRTRRSS